MNNNLITGVLAGVSGVLSYIFGPWDAMIMVLIAVVALDYITGVAYAAVSKTLSSVIGFKGLLKMYSYSYWWRFPQCLTSWCPPQTVR